VGYISAIWTAGPFGPISTKIGTLVGVDDVIIHSNFGLNTFKGFRSTWATGEKEDGWKFPISHWLCWSSVQQCCRYRAACDV